MPTRFVTFHRPIIFTESVKRTFMKLFEKNEIPGNISYTEDVLNPGDSRSYEVEGSSASYTVALDEMGNGILQRIMSKPGARYGAGGKEGNFVVEKIESEFGQKSQEFPFTAESTLVIPIAVGSKEGDSVRAVFIHVPDKK